MLLQPSHSGACTEMTVPFAGRAFPGWPAQSLSLTVIGDLVLSGKRGRGRWRLCPPAGGGLRLSGTCHTDPLTAFWREVSLPVTCYQDRHKGKGPMKRPFSEAPRGYGEAALPSRLDFRPSLR